MTNVSATAEKVATRAHLFSLAERALEKEGWKVDRIPRSGKSSLRSITRKGESKTVSIRTSQDTWIAFPRTKDDKRWATLESVDFVVASSVDDRHNPKFAQVHILRADEMRARFDRAYEARRAAGYTLPVGRGIWLSLYEVEAQSPVTLVGAGAGLTDPPVLKEPLTDLGIDIQPGVADEQDEDEPIVEDGPLTIAEAKRRLALTFGVTEADVKITISS